MKALLPVVVFADVDEAFVASRSSSVTLDLEEILAREQVTLVLCSSMTRAELETCQQELGIRCPFICESGAAVLVPHGHFPFDVLSDRELPGYHVLEFGKPYSETVAVLHRAATRLEIPVIGFSDLSIEQVAKECGLSLSHARLAKLREYDEPFRLVNVTRNGHERLWRALRGLRMSCTHRAAFEHVGAAVDRGMCVNVLSKLYRRTLGPIVTVGLGSAEHSAPLFHRVKLPFVAGARAVTPSTSSEPGIPWPHVTSDSITWIETILHLVDRARERRRPRVSAAG